MNGIATMASALCLLGNAGRAQTVPATSATITYHTVDVDGLKLFYREAGPKDAPTLLLLHGFPSSSTMFESLIPRLAGHYHLVAPRWSIVEAL